METTPPRNCGTRLEMQIPHSVRNDKQVGEWGKRG